MHCVRRIIIRTISYVKIIYWRLQCQRNTLSNPLGNSDLHGLMIYWYIYSDVVFTFFSNINEKVNNCIYV